MSLEDSNLALAQIDSGEAMGRKHRGIRKTLGKNKDWADYAIVCIRDDIQIGKEVTGEDIRTLVNEEPSHPNAWGALVNRAIKEGLIHPTGQYVAMSAKKSNGRRTPVYARVA